MTKKPSFSQKLQYRLDNIMSKGTGAMIVLLFLVAAVIILLVAGIVHLTRIAPPKEDGGVLSFIELIWFGLMRTLDAGTMGGDQGPWWFLIAMLVITLAGVFVVSSLIGILSSGLEGQLERLRKGRSRVLESGHTLILGWSPQIFTILNELMIANENQKRARIVILADKDKVEMEDEVRERVETRGRMRVICRSGNPIDLTDLEIGSPHNAKSIIVLPPEDDDPDSYVIRTVLAITNSPNRRPDSYHIVTQIRDPQNRDVVRMVGQKDHVHAVLMGDLIARVVAQTSRQSGLSVVYTELLNFGGDEIYFKEEPSLVGKTFGEALLAYENSTLIGLQFVDGRVQLNPPMNTKLSAGDKIVAISADDDTILLSRITDLPVDENAIRKDGKPRQAAPEKCLILGWNRCAETIIRELDHYVAKGSRLTVVADAEASEDVGQAGQKIKACCSRLPNQKVVFQNGDTTERNLLEGVKARDYDHVIVLSYAGLETQAADAKTLVTLLHLRDIAEKDETPFSIVSEMLDLRNRELAEVAHVDDFIVSDHLISLMLAQLSENGDLYAVFQDLFDPEGSEIYLKPVAEYAATGKPVNFYTLAEAARRRGETAIGYRLFRETGDAEKSYGVHTKPNKSALVTFAPEDKIIVLAEE